MLLRRLYQKILLGMVVLTMVLILTQYVLVANLFHPDQKTAHSTSRLPQIPDAHPPYPGIVEPAGPRFVRVPPNRSNGPRIELAPPRTYLIGVPYGVQFSP